MRFDLRLHGRTAGGRDCVLEVSVYGSSQKQMEEELTRRAEIGPWFYKDTNEQVPESEERITIEHVEPMGDK